MVEKYLWLPQLLKDELLMEAERMSPRETGGILIGYVGDNGDYVITHITGPGMEASHGRFRFKPDHAYQQATINRIFEETSGGSDYLGDWHTHPSGGCSMSWLDHRTLQRIGTTSGINISFPVMMIVCDGREKWGVSAWKYSSSRWVLGADTESLFVKVY